MSGREIVGLRLTLLGTHGSTSSAFYPPQLLHQVLVEATAGEAFVADHGAHAQIGQRLTNVVQPSARQRDVLR